MKSILFSLLLLLCSCGNEPAPSKKKVENPITVQFFETYSIEDIKEEWLNACKWTSENDHRANSGKDPLEEIGFKGLKSIVVNEFNSAIAFAKTTDLSAADSMLKIPEVIKCFPKDLRFMWARYPQNMGPGKVYYLYAVKVPANKKAPVDSHDILESVPALDKDNPDMVDLHVTLTKSGSRKMEAFSRKNIKQHIAITLDGKVVSCSEIWTVITNRMEIDGGFTMDQAGYISDRINAGR